MKSTKVFSVFCYIKLLSWRHFIKPTYGVQNDAELNSCDSFSSKVHISNLKSPSKSSQSLIQVQKVQKKSRSSPHQESNRGPHNSFEDFQVTSAHTFLAHFFNSSSFHMNFPLFFSLISCVGRILLSFFGQTIWHLFSCSLFWFMGVFFQSFFFVSFCRFNTKSFHKKNEKIFKKKLTLVFVIPDIQSSLVGHFLDLRIS